MHDLIPRLEEWRGLRLWLICVGSAEQGDDGFGPRLAELLREPLRGAGAPVRVLEAGLAPERYVGPAARAGCQVLVFADAADFGAQPGALLLATGAELQSRPLPACTHRMPLSVLARYAEALGVRTFLLGVQPASLRPGAGLSPAVEGTAQALAGLLADALRAPSGREAAP